MREETNFFFLPASHSHWPSSQQRVRYFQTTPLRTVTMRLLVPFSSASEYFRIIALSLCMCQRVWECDYTCTYSHHAFCLIFWTMFCWTCLETWLKRAHVTKSDSQVTAFVTSFDVFLMHAVMCELHVCVRVGVIWPWRTLTHWTIGR